MWTNENLTYICEPPPHVHAGLCQLIPPRFVGRGNLQSTRIRKNEKMRDTPHTTISLPIVMSAETDSMSGGDSVPFEEENVRSGTPDPGLKHLRKMDLTSEEQAGYASQCKEWVPGDTRVQRLCAGLRDNHRVTVRCICGRTACEEKAVMCPHMVVLSGEPTAVVHWVSSDMSCGKYLVLQRAAPVTWHSFLSYSVLDHHYTYKRKRGSLGPRVYDVRPRVMYEIAFVLEL